MTDFDGDEKASSEQPVPSLPKDANFTNHIGLWGFMFFCLVFIGLLAYLYNQVSNYSN